MRFVPQTLLSGLILIAPMHAYASPWEDAEYIIVRQIGPTAMQAIRDRIKGALVDVYAEPLSLYDIDIADRDGFIALISDETADRYLTYVYPGGFEALTRTFSGDQLSELAELLRADPDTTALEMCQLERDRTFQWIEDNEDLVTVEIVEDDDLPSTQDVTLPEYFNHFGCSIFSRYGSSWDYLPMLRAWEWKMSQLTPGIDNPISILALQADGILDYPNPIVRQTLLREVEQDDDNTGIAFIRPPSSDN